MAKLIEVNDLFFLRKKIHGFISKHVLNENKLLAERIFGIQERRQCTNRNIIIFKFINQIPIFVEINIRGYIS